MVSFCFFRLMLLAFCCHFFLFLFFLFLLVQVTSHLFILGIINAGTCSVSCSYKYGQMGKLTTSSTLSVEIQILSTSPERGHLGWLPAQHDSGHVFQSASCGYSPISFQSNCLRIIEIFTQAVIPNPLPIHIIRSHITPVPCPRPIAGLCSNGYSTLIDEYQFKSYTTIFSKMSVFSVKWTDCQVIVLLKINV